jgi:glycosyltransferase involved in cell wall biosynthesis
VQAHVADDADAFAAAIVRVLRDDDHAAALVAAGRAHVEAGFRWSAIADRFADDLLEDLR